MAQHSLAEAKRRLNKERPSWEHYIETHSTSKEYAASLQSTLSVVGDSRPLGALAMHGSVLATGSWAGRTRLWDKQSGRLVMDLQDTEAHRVTALCFPVEQDLLLSGSADGRVLYCDCQTGGEPRTVLQAHTDRVTRIRTVSSLGMAVSSSVDESWRLWSIESGQCVWAQSGLGAAVHALAVHPDCSLLAAGDAAEGLRLWDLRTGTLVLEFRGHGGLVSAAAFSADGVTLASGGQDHSVRLWDLRRRSSLHTLGGHCGVVSDVCWLDAQLLATGCFDGVVRVWSSVMLDVCAELRGHEDKVSALAVSDMELYSAGYDRTWKRWAGSLQPCRTTT
jgi:U4/U6 small nuclear ribonucleoprotein PRP4